MTRAIGQRFRVSRGGCWQCVADCRSRLAEALTFFQVAYNGWQLGEVAEGLACSVAAIAPNCGYKPFIF